MVAWELHPARRRSKNGPLFGRLVVVAHPPPRHRIALRALPPTWEPELMPYTTKASYLFELPRREYSITNASE